MFAWVHESLDSECEFWFGGDLLCVVFWFLMVACFEGIVFEEWVVIAFGVGVAGGECAE